MSLSAYLYVCLPCPVCACVEVCGMQSILGSQCGPICGESGRPSDAARTFPGRRLPSSQPPSCLLGRRLAALAAKVTHQQKVTDNHSSSQTTCAKGGGRESGAMASCEEEKGSTLWNSKCKRGVAYICWNMIFNGRMSPQEREREREGPQN